MRRRSRLAPPAKLLLALALLWPGPAGAGELMAAVYLGKAWTGNADLRLKLPDGTDLRYRSVSWDDVSFQLPLYLGGRLGWWSSEGESWGAALDFTHAKLIAPLGQQVRVEGLRAGRSVNGREPLAGTFGALSFTHGHNLLTANALHRWRPWSAGGKLDVQPYLGLGIGIAYPHVEVTAAGRSTQEYQLAGLALQALIGLDLSLVAGLSAMLEYKVDLAFLGADLAGGGSVHVEPLTHQLLFGPVYHLR